MREIRTLNAEDAFHAVAQIYVRSWQHSYRGMLPQLFLDRLTDERWLATLRARPERSICLFEDGKMLGTVMTDFCREKGQEGWGEIVSLYLLPEAIGFGHGRLLTEAAMDALRAEGCEQACLWVFRANEYAAEFYRHLGFAHTGRSQTEMYGGEPIELIEMARVL